MQKTSLDKGWEHSVGPGRGAVVVDRRLVSFGTMASTRIVMKHLQPNLQVLRSRGRMLKVDH
jgi:hypothetical protein